MQGRYADEAQPARIYPSFRSYILSNVPWSFRWRWPCWAGCLPGKMRSRPSLSTSIFWRNLGEALIDLDNLGNANYVCIRIVPLVCDMMARTR